MVDGRVGYQLTGGPERFAGPGETVTFAPGQMHRFWNAADGVLTCQGAASSPLNFEYFLTELFASMRRAGGGNPSPLDMAFLLGRYRTEFGIAEVPAPVQKFLFPGDARFLRDRPLPAICGRAGTRGSSYRYAIAGEWDVSCVESPGNSNRTSVSASVRRRALWRCATQARRNRRS